MRKIQSSFLLCVLNSIKRHGNGFEKHIRLVNILFIFHFANENGHKIRIIPIDLFGADF